VAPLEPWEKVLVSRDRFLTTAHGEMQCTYCHGGISSAPDKETAHTGIVADPSGASKDNNCATCHQDQSEHFADSLHSNLGGYWTTLIARSSPEAHARLETMFGNHCASCHTTCGDCHISQPQSVGGGFVDGHVINKTPSMSQNCTACHGSRVGNEYLGKNEGIPGDVHFRTARMNCMACHTGAEMHDSSASCKECHAEPVQIENRYSGKPAVDCDACHAQVGKPGDSIVQHTLHGDTLSCQVCHSVQYTNCDSCHVAISEKTGNPFFTTQSTYFTFLIGKNANVTFHRPYEYVVVRHVPADRDAYSFYGADLLSNFDAVPTWAFATPHNIQRKTPQNSSCNCRLTKNFTR
jgi:hypothetical protein